MRKKRNFSTNIFSNEKLQRAEDMTSIAVKWLFLGLIAIADREGRLVDDAASIKREVFPYSNIKIQEVNQMLDALHECGVIQKYSIDGKKYCLIASFLKNQYIVKTERKSKLPPPAQDIKQ